MDRGEISSVRGIRRGVHESCQMGVKLALSSV